MQVSAYGVISFGASYSTLPLPFPLSSSHVLIAPFWDYFNVQNSGQVLFRLSDNQTLLNEVGSTINGSLGFDFTPTMLFIATWIRIPQAQYGNSRNNV